MPEIEFVMVADHAEVINGKLYLMGGGWTDLRRPSSVDGQSPPPTHMSIVASVLVGWTETNQAHKLDIRVEDSDATIKLAELETVIEMGRPAGIPPGSDQRALLAVNAGLAFPKPGTYRVLATLGDDTKLATFRVHDLTAHLGSSG